VAIYSNSLPWSKKEAEIMSDIHYCFEDIDLNDEFFDEIQKQTRSRVIWLCCHDKQAEVILASFPHFFCSTVDAIVLNTCYSADAKKALSSLGTLRVIALHNLDTPVNDKDAFLVSWKLFGGLVILDKQNGTLDMYYNKKAVDIFKRIVTAYHEDVSPDLIRSSPDIFRSPNTLGAPTAEIKSADILNVETVVLNVGILVNLEKTVQAISLPGVDSPHEEILINFEDQADTEVNRLLKKEGIHTVKAKFEFESKILQYIRSGKINPSNVEQILTSLNSR